MQYLVRIVQWTLNIRVEAIFCSRKPDGCLCGFMCAAESTDVEHGAIRLLCRCAHVLFHHILPVPRIRAKRGGFGRGEEFLLDSGSGVVGASAHDCSGLLVLLLLPRPAACQVQHPWRSRAGLRRALPLLAVRLLPGASGNSLPQLRPWVLGHPNHHLCPSPTTLRSPNTPLLIHHFSSSFRTFTEAVFFDRFVRGMWLAPRLLHWIWTC